jgi:Zn-dependent protease
VNLFNLIPVWQLDGSRGFHSLTCQQRLLVLGAAVLLWYTSGEAMFLLIALGCAYRMFTKDAAQAPDPVCLRQYAALLVALAAIDIFAKSRLLP